MSTCKYCCQPNHKQLDCPRTKEDYPQPPIINGNRQKGKQADPPAEKNDAIDFGFANSEPCTTATTEKCKHNEATKKSEVTKKKREREASSPDLPKGGKMNRSEDKINCSCPKCNTMVCSSERSVNNIYCWDCSIELSLWKTCCTYEQRLFPKAEVGNLRSACTYGSCNARLTIHPPFLTFRHIKQ